MVRERRWRWLVLAVVILALPTGALALYGAPAELEALQQAVVARALRAGDQGEPVSALQRALQAAGFAPGPIDGVFGPLTEGAVRVAQSRLGVDVDGLAGRLTLGALQRALSDTAGPEQGEAESAAVHPQLFALTFNGPPEPALVPAILRELDRWGMRATFFAAGEDAELRPDLLSRIAGSGHEVASAGYANLDMSRLTPVMMRAQLLQANRAIRDAVGRRPRFFRPPLGALSRDLSVEAERAGLKVALWSNVGAGDPIDTAPGDLAERLSRVVYPGAVLMLHQDRLASVAALDELLRDLRERGYQSVTLSELLGRRE